MATILSEETIQHTIHRIERTIGVNLGTSASRNEDEYTMQINREVATYKDGNLTDTSRIAIPATVQNGGFETEIHMLVGELKKHSDRKIVMEDGREIEVSDLVEIIAKGCDIIADIRREERRLHAASQV